MQGPSLSRRKRSPICSYGLRTNHVIRIACTTHEPEGRLSFTKYQLSRVSGCPDSEWNSTFIPQQTRDQKFSVYNSAVWLIVKRLRDCHIPCLEQSGMHLGWLLGMAVFSHRSCNEAETGLNSASGVSSAEVMASPSGYIYRFNPFRRNMNE